MPLPPEKVAAYHRARRARLKAEKGLQPRTPATPKSPPRPPSAIPLGRPLTAWERQSDAKMEAIKARGGTPVFDNVALRWRDASALVHPAPAPTHALAPPRSMIACGGKPPGPPVTASIAEATAHLRNELATHARANEKLTRRDLDKENRLAAMERREAQCEAARRMNAELRGQMLDAVLAFFSVGVSRR
jgi:hypothetical protein